MTRNKNDNDTFSLFDMRWKRIRKEWFPFISKKYYIHLLLNFIYHFLFLLKIKNSRQKK